MTVITKIDPQAILTAFSQAKILVSMSDGPTRYDDSRNVPYLTLTHTGIKQEGQLTNLTIRQSNDEEFVASLREAYLEQLIKHAFMHGDDVIIEWRVWPEIEVSDRKVTGAVYSRLTMYPNPNPEKAKYEQRTH